MERSPPLAPRRAIRPRLRSGSEAPARLSGVVASSLVCLAVLLAPAASAHRSVHYGAPYSKAVVQLPNYTNLYGCAKMTSTPMRFSSSTGVGGFSGKTSAHWCPKTLTMVNQGFAEAAGQAIVDIPVKTFPGTSTPTVIGVTWSIHGSSAVSIGYGGVACPPTPVNNSTGNGFSYCAMDAGTGVFGDAYLLDRTNGSVIYAANYPTLLNLYVYTYNDTYCYSFVCYTYNNSANSPTTSWSGTSLQTWWINGSLNHSHRYVVETYVYAWVYANVYEAPKCSTMASLDLLASTNGTKLVSVLVR
jgi:hypothetical protein